MKLPITLPFDDFVSLARIMFISNRYIEINISAISKGGTRLEGCASSINDLDEINGRNQMTITSIEVRQPQFSIGDTVMIVDTGEIGKIEDINDDDNMYRINGNKFINRVTLSEIVKIDPSLIPLLQDNGTTAKNS